jgi:hypothetical protein
MDDIRYIDIDLDQIDIWKDELDSLEYCQETFGELGYILYEYYQNYDISIFEKYKNKIGTGLVDSLLSHKKPVLTFFGKTDKILMLNNYWNTHQQWRDPLVARLVGTKNNKPFYYAHPGRDRYGIMKGLGVKSYEFLYIPHQLLNDSNYETIKSFWGEHGSTLVIKPSDDDPNRTVLGNHDTEQYTKYHNLIKWLKAK